MGFISSKRVLIIIADNCELTDNIRYNLPEAPKKNIDPG